MTRLNDNLRANLAMLVDKKGWSIEELARRSHVSSRMIHFILKDERTASIEIAEKLARAFGLEGWHILMPNLERDLVDSPTISRLFNGYQKASSDGRALIDQVVTREAKLSNGNHG